MNEGESDINNLYHWNSKRSQNVMILSRNLFAYLSDRLNIQILFRFCFHGLLEERHVLDKTKDVSEKRVQHFCR